MDYEEKYKFIDIGKMHEKVQLLSTKLDLSDSRCKMLEQELFYLRERILRATTQRFSQAGARGGDAHLGLDGMPTKNEKGNWQGEAEMEETA